MHESHPTVTEYNGRTTFVSRVHYDYCDAKILETWRECGPQIICNNAEFISIDGIAEKWTFYAGDGGSAIIEMMYEGPAEQRDVIKGLHDMFVNAHLALLPGASVSKCR